MKRNNKSKHKRMEQKRMKRKKRNRKKVPQIQWLTDTMFAMYFDDENINNLFSYVTVEIIDDDFELSYEDNQHLQGNIQSETDETDFDRSDIVDLN